MDNAFIALAVAAVVELARRAEQRDYRAVVTIIAAATVGALAGYFNIGVESIEAGIIAGLSASGIVTVATRV